MISGNFGCQNANQNGRKYPKHSNSDTKRFSFRFFFLFSPVTKKLDESRNKESFSLNMKSRKKSRNFRLCETKMRVKKILKVARGVMSWFSSVSFSHKKVAIHFLPLLWEREGCMVYLRRWKYSYIPPLWKKDFSLVDDGRFPHSPGSVNHN